MFVLYVYVFSINMNVINLFKKLFSISVEGFQGIQVSLEQMGFNKKYESIVCYSSKNYTFKHK